MITWQDPVALSLAALLVAASWLFRRALIRRGSAPHCTQCKADAASPAAPSERRPPRPTVIDAQRLRLGRKRGADRSM